MKGDREAFDFIADCTAYLDQSSDDFAPKTIPVAARTPVLAAVADDETRKLNGQNVPVVRFTIGTGGWCWIPRRDFARLAVKARRDWD
jgi:hypothetical protein